MYTAAADGEAIAAAGDMLELIAPSDAALAIHRIWIEQETEAGDAASEQIKVSIKRVTGAPTSGSGGTAVTPRPLVGGAPAAGSTAEANNTTDLTGGTSVDLMVRSFNVHNGLEIVFTPEERPELAPSTRLLITLDNTPADSVTFNYGVTFEEIGG
jgi:hypothetical protein